MLAHENFFYIKRKRHDRSSLRQLYLRLNSLLESLTAVPVADESDLEWVVCKTILQDDVDFLLEECSEMLIEGEIEDHERAVEAFLIRAETVIEDVTFFLRHRGIADTH